MKKIFITIGAFLLLMACNQSSQPEKNNSNTDTASHDGHANDDHSEHNSTGAQTSGATMMSLMEKNMNEMMNAKSLGNNEKDFAFMMKIHHTGAVEMAKLQLAQGTDQELKNMAQNIVREQEREIGELDAFLSTNKTTPTGDSKNSVFYDRVIKEMKMGEMNHSGSIDHQFVQMMIPHHKDGIAMADYYLQSGATNENLKSIASQIKTDQQKEIQQMETWLASQK